MKTTKYVIFSAIFFGYAMFAYNRKGVSYAVPKLMEEGLTSGELGLILSAQNMAYAISKFLGGIISDRLSSRVLFSAGLLTSGLAAFLFSISDSITLFTVIWFLNGLSQGVGWPSIAKLLKNWFDPGELGTWWSLASASANLSGCVAPFIASYLILTFSWRFSLTFVGGLTIFAAAVAFIFIQDEPKSESRKSLISSKDKKQDSPQKRSPTKKQEKPAGNAFSTLLRSPFIWVVSICYLVVSSVKTGATDWSQVYLMRECHQSSLVANGFVSSLEFGGFLGGIAAGYLSDMLLKRTMKNRKELPARGHPRMLIGTAFAAVSLACLYLFTHHVNEDTSTIFLNQIGILLGAAVYGQIAIFGVVATESVTSNMSGTAHAIAALAANVGSIVAGLPFAKVAEHYSWSKVFFLLEVISLAVFVFMLVTKSVSYRVRAIDVAKKTN